VDGEVLEEGGKMQVLGKLVCPVTYCLLAQNLPKVVYNMGTVCIQIIGNLKLTQNLMLILLVHYTSNIIFFIC
jgi:hypothetical protein